MLYVTTRNNRDAYTAQRALREDCGPDGGMYLPFHAPCFSPEDLQALAGKPFNQRIADMLNLLFGTRLTGWDVDFAIGRRSVQLQTLRQRVVMAELWRNPQWDFGQTVRSLTTLLTKDASVAPGDWVQVAVRISMLFGIFGELCQAGFDQRMDVCMVSGDFRAPISAWYARQWGLPIGSLICCCNENQGLWDLICHGQLRTDAVSVPTAIPEADVALPRDLERLIYACGGVSEVHRYLDVCRRGGTYCPGDALLAQLRSGLYVNVVSSERMRTTIPSVLRTHGYLLSPSAALVYAGMQDYRAKTGRTGLCLILTEKGPLADGDILSAFLGISQEELRQYV